MDRSWVPSLCTCDKFVHRQFGGPINRTTAIGFRIFLEPRVCPSDKFVHERCAGSKWTVTDLKGHRNYPHPSQFRTPPLSGYLVQMEQLAPLRDVALFTVTPTLGEPHPRPETGSAGLAQRRRTPTTRPARMGRQAGPNGPEALVRAAYQTGVP